MQTALAEDLLAWMQEIQQVTFDDERAGHGVDDLLRNTMEELGEFAACVSVEDGHKPHKDPADLKEVSQEEAIDLIICALSLFFIRAGSLEQLLTYGQKKLAKWHANVSDRLADRLRREEHEIRRKVRQTIRSLRQDD